MVGEQEHPSLQAGDVVLAPGGLSREERYTMQEEARKGPGFDLVRAIWSRRKWVAIVVFAAPCSAAVSLAKFLPNLYQSTATVLVEGQQVPEAFVKSTVTSELQTRLQTITQQALSRSRLEALINGFGLYPDLRRGLPLEEIVELMRDAIRLEIKGDDQQAGPRRGRGPATVAFSISYRGSDPQTVALVTDTLASFFIEENLKVRGLQATGTAEFLKGQLEETKKRLDQQERQLSDFKRRYMGELPEQMHPNLTTLERLDAQLRLNSDNQIRAIERREALIKQLAEEGSVPLPAGSAGAGSVGGADATAARFTRLRQELTNLRTRFTDQHPAVVRVQAEIAALQRQLAERASEGRADAEPSVPASPQAQRLKQLLGDVEAETKGLKGEEKNLRSAIVTYQQRVENIPRREQEFLEVSRDYDMTKELYRALLKRHEEAQLAESMEQRQKGEQFRILDPAIPSNSPAAPNRIKLLLMGVMVSLGLAAGAVVLAEQLDTSFHMVDDLRASTPVPVLVTIPKIITQGDARRRQRRFRRAAAAAMLGLALIVGTSYLVARGNQELVRILAGRPS